jgi:beta-1,4-mannosyltransferase
MRILVFPRDIRRSDNPYGELLYRDMPSLGLEVDSFSLWRAWGSLWKRYDIFHLHWPEYYLNRSLPKALIGSLMVLLSTAWLRLHGARILWTVHNPHSHALSHPTLESWFWRSFTRMLDGYVSLSDSCAKWVATDIPNLRDAESAVIPHGHYRQAYPAPVGKVAARIMLGLPPRQTVLLFFGAVSPYKNVPHLVTTFRNSVLPDSRMLIAGRAEARQGHHVEAAAANDERIRLDLRRIPRGEVQMLFSAADLVVLPFSDIMHSGSAILALSFNKPVLVPARGSLPELQALVGTDWVRTYVGELTPEILTAAAKWAKSARRKPRPNLSSFEWPNIVQATVDLYSRLCAMPAPVPDSTEQTSSMQRHTVAPVADNRQPVTGN